MERIRTSTPLGDTHDVRGSRQSGSVPSAVSAMQQLESALVSIGVTKAHKKIIALILAGCVFDSLEQNTIGIVSPLLRRQWGLTMADIGFLNTITFSCAAAGRLLSGLIADRYGRRIILSFNLILFTIGSLGCAFAPNFLTLSFFRAVVGFGIGGEVSTAITILSEFCSPTFRGVAAGLVNVGAGGIGNFLAPLYGLMIFTLFSGPNNWRFLFISLALPCFLVVFYRRLIPESPRFLVSAGRIKDANAVLSKLASGSLRTHEKPIVPYVTETTIKPGTCQSGSWKTIFSPHYVTRTVFVSITILMCYGAQLSVLTLLPTIFISLGQSYSSSLIETSISQAGSILGTLFASFLAHFVSRKKVLTVGAVCAALSAISIAFVSHNAHAVMICAIIFQLFALLLNTSTWIYVPELYPTQTRAFGVAFVLAAGSAAGAIMPMITGFIFDHNNLTAVLALVSAMYGICLICTLFIPETFGKSMEDNLPPLSDINAFAQEHA